ncbi:MAG: hypothetical protein CMB80_01140 [Flammeovirgaceae bacterium]|nr:hypothetical protein [Flammeovirgaceae bacterium]|tara:strand:- start:1360 stop:1881 length:522 start_codon:yes stop_codon:yes gene_type:complete
MHLFPNIRSTEQIKKNWKSGTRRYWKLWKLNYADADNRSMTDVGQIRDDVEIAKDGTVLSDRGSAQLKDDDYAFGISKGIHLCRYIDDSLIPSRSVCLNQADIYFFVPAYVERNDFVASSKTHIVCMKMKIKFPELEKHIRQYVNEFSEWLPSDGWEQFIQDVLKKYCPTEKG